MSKLVSVVIPAYNAEDNIKNTINSVINQTYDNFEIIVVDDGSIDNTKEIVLAFQDNDDRVKYHYKKNGGVSSARNMGMFYSNGDYVTFLDSDDTFENSFIDKMISKIDENECQICYTGHNIVADGIKKKRKTKFSNRNVLEKYVNSNISIHTSSWLIKKNFIDVNNVQFKEGMSWGEDNLFFSQLLALTNEVCYVEEYLTNYIVEHSENQLSSFTLELIDKDFKYMSLMLNDNLINKNKNIPKIIKDYKLKALLVGKLNQGLVLGYNKKELKSYYNKYKDVINSLSFRNGKKSILLNYNILKLRRVFK